MEKAARRIVEKLRLHGHEAFFAGGWVRDFLLRRKPKDIDIATDALPDEVRRLFPRSRSVGAQFGVIQVFLYGHGYEVATFRSDGEYVDGRHPSSVAFSGPEQDARRRDFTINGLFYDPVTDRLIDYVHGRSDIRRGLIRTIGVPHARFAEDKLRMLRAIRFACSLGFKIAPETWSVIQSLAAGILQVSWERIRDELIQILTGPAPDSGLDLLHDSGLLVHILPEIEAMREQAKPAEVAGGTNLFARTKSAMNLLRKPSTPLAFATLLHEAGDPAVSREVCRRLRMSTGQTDRIVDLVSTHADFVNNKEMRDSSLRRIYRRPGFGDHLELLRVHCISHQIKLDAYFRYLNRTKEYVKNPEASLFVTGDDLIAMGYAPGPDFSRILQRVEDLQLDGVLRSRDEALEYVRTAFPVSAGSRL